MFNTYIAYRIRPVVEDQSADNELNYRAFNTLDEAKADCGAYEERLRVNGASGVEGQRIIWTLFGVYPDSAGVQVEQPIANFASDAGARDLLASILGCVVSPDAHGFVYLKTAAATPSRVVAGYIATVQILIPGKGDPGFAVNQTVSSKAQACDFVSEMLRQAGLVDWSYLPATPNPSLKRYDPVAYREGEAFA